MPMAALTAAMLLLSAIPIKVAHASGCAPMVASSALRFSSGRRGINRGVVPDGFITPSNGSITVNGIDVSKYQADADFDGVRACDGSFVYVRLSAGAREDNELEYRALWNTAKAAGLITGPYHSFTVIDSERPVSKLSPGAYNELLQKNLLHARAEAELFIKRLKEMLGHDPVTGVVGTYGAPYLPAVLALAVRPQKSKSSADQKAFGQIYRESACAWIRTFQADPQFLNQPVILFTKPFIYRDFDLGAASCGLNRLKVWISYHGSTGDVPSTERKPLYKSAIQALCRGPDGSNRCIFQQYTSFGGFAIYNPNAGLDLDRYFGTLSSLRKMMQTARAPANQ